MNRIAIQILSFNKPKYLDQTLASLKTVIGPNDKICVLEQSDDKNSKKECLELCDFYNVDAISLPKNLGQRGATNIVYHTGFFYDSEYVMLSDHDNIFYKPLDIYCDKLKNDKTIWCSTGYHSPEHDVERKDWDWLIKSSARAGHMVFRANDFLALMPIDLNYTAGVNCGWFCGLDWYLTHWGTYLHPGIRQEKEFIACYPGGVEHIGRESSWQGSYDDEYNLETLEWMRIATLGQIIKKYPPRHTYLNYAYPYEEKVENLSRNIKEHRYNIYNNNITVYDFEHSQSPNTIYNELINNEYNLENIIPRDGDIVIDIGANIGMFCISLAKQNPNIKIYAFEPLEESYNNLMRGIKVNNIDNIVAVNCAVTKDGRDVVSIAALNQSGGAMIIDKDLINIVDTQNFKINIVQSLTLQDIFLKFKIDNCKLLKIDIEGFEHEVLNTKDVDWVYDRIEYLSGEFHFQGAEELKEEIENVFPEGKVCISLNSTDIKRPTDLLGILKSVSSDQLDISNDVKLLTPKE